MKNLVMALSVLVSLPALASSKVCAGEKLYVSDVRSDFGTQPPVGTLTGTHVILFNRKVLLKYDTFQEKFVHGVPPYRVRFEGEEKVLEEIQGGPQHLKTYTVQAVLEEVDSLTHEVKKEIGRDYVVCREVSNFVP